MALEIWLVGQFNFEALYNYVRGYPESDDVSEQEGGRFTFHLRGVKDVTYQAYSGGKVRILVDDFSDPGALVGIIWDMAEIASGKPPMFTPKKIVPLNTTTYRIARPLILSELALESLGEIDDAEALSKETAEKIQSVKQKLVELHRAVRLFDYAARDFQGPADHAESSFHYLNRSGRTEAQHVRNVLERWFEDFPLSGKAELRSRFRSDDDRGHSGAFFELYCYTLLCHHDFAIEVHPTSDRDKSKKPDFLALLKDKRLFYMESTLAAKSDIDNAAQARLDQVYDTLDRLDSPNFFVGVEIKNLPPHAPSGSNMRSFLDSQLRHLDPDEVSKVISEQGWDAVPHWTWNDNRWEIIFFPIPKSREGRNKPGVRPIGSQTYGAAWIDSEKPLLHALKSKASCYGEFDCPYIIAVNVLDVFVSKDDVADVLFGKECFLLNPQTRDAEAQRAQDGFWIGPEGTRNRRVSGVLVAFNLDAWSIARKTPTLWHNPWASCKIDTDLWKGPQMVPDMQHSWSTLKDGKPSWELLQLNPEWPEDAKQ